MIMRISKFEWLVIYGRYEQMVVGTRFSAERTLEDLKVKWSKGMLTLPWYKKMFEVISLKF